MEARSGLLIIMSARVKVLASIVSEKVKVMVAVEPLLFDRLVAVMELSIGAILSQPTMVRFATSVEAEKAVVPPLMDVFTFVPAVPLD